LEGELATLRALLDGEDRPGLYVFLEEAALFRRRLEGDERHADRRT
jgi:hypothetical protein